MTLSAAKQTKVIGPAAAIKGPGPAGCVVATVVVVGVVLIMISPSGLDTV